MSALDFQAEIVKTSRKRSASIQIIDGKVKIRVPKSLSDKRINDLIKKRTPWIQIKLEEYSKRPTVVQKKYIDGEAYAYLGKKFSLKHIEGESPSIKLKSGQFLVSIPKNKLHKNIKTEDLILNWYRSHAQKYLQDRTDEFSKVIGVSPSSVSIKNYKSRWGSCAINGNIDYNWKIIQAPKNVIDYVVVHELCHLIEHNHSPKYWGNVERIMPNWRDSKDWLKHNSDILKKSIA
ncbi:M48 family metallopeptidase [Gammaproteobacteria bacterium]|nr:M48 family metallopeptidase [Gammaproteobacteria bacterium]